MAAPSCVITIVKSMFYRANPAEEWSNTYAFSGPTPTDATAWRALFDALVAEEKKVYVNDSKVVGAYGYSRIPVHGDHAIWSVDMNVSPNTPVAGTASKASGTTMAGDQASWIRWGLDRYSSTGKRVYLRKYFHSGMIAATGGDQLDAAYRTALLAFGTKMRDGTFLGSRVLVDKDGNQSIGVGNSTYVTTRTLKRRGKRPPT